MADAKRLYEGLFLLSQSAAGDLAAATDHVRSILERSEAEIIGLYKWDERKLAYMIRGQRRGTYLHAYFRAPAASIGEIDRDCNLSEQILRSIILKADHVGEIELEQFKKDAAASLDAKAGEAARKPKREETEESSDDSKKSDAAAVAAKVE